MAAEAIEEKVKQIIVDELGVEESEVTPNARFIDDLGADSLDTVELVMRFEEEFGIEIRTRMPKRFSASAMPSPTLSSTRSRPQRLRQAVRLIPATARGIGLSCFSHALRRCLGRLQPPTTE